MRPTRTEVATAVSRPARRRAAAIFTTVIVVISLVTALRPAVMMTGWRLHDSSGDAAMRRDAELASLRFHLRAGEVLEYLSDEPFAGSYYQAQYALVPAIVVDHPGPRRLVFDVVQPRRAAAMIDTSTWREVARTDRGHFVLYEAAERR